ncbi:uncharacterized protein M421DRAFT_417177 [Didymella exigua CBS 183.55]|uniref:Uncharacterized protein n=1 Tax=Didymella exigua CBS 183.55 TaxID=1150837 RepID=A0A6A5RVH2_9PLEO|nr:uncharacterized protein M421DRAFT_417177 [Didymella exigua CBS 183.55]KAF1932461.1 hypothetical protein M421DRAFT_417177 [Didymella exigua CBS 183.55]
MADSLTSQQPVSPLLRLPLELRKRIYAHVFSGYRITVLWSNTGALRYATLPDSELLFHGSGRLAFNTLIAPTQVCRQMYAETRLLPYKYSTYNVSLIINFTLWMGRLDEALHTTVWEALNESQRLYVQEVRDEHWGGSEDKVVRRWRRAGTAMSA